jgi:hypothetical protein
LDPEAAKTRVSPAVTVLLFAAAFLSMARSFSDGRYGAGYETLNIARTLAETGTFGNPYGILPTGPTAHCAPLYPMFLAMLIKFFGYSGEFVLITNICALAMYALHTAMLPRVSLLLFNRQGPGILAALMTILLPIYLFLPEFENMYDGAGLVCFCLISAAFARSPGRWGAVGIGAFIGVLALLNTATLAVVVLWLVYLAWQKSAVRLWRWTVWAAVGTVLVVSPWTVRNCLRFHQFVPIRSNLGVELYVANNDTAQPSFGDNLPTFWQRHPAGSLEEARAVVQMGEAAYSESRKQQAVAWIRTHPGRFLQLAAARARMFWFAKGSDPRFFAWSMISTTVVSFIGLSLLLFRRQAVAIFLAGTWLIYPSIYYCVQHNVRYREPIMWTTLLAAGYVIWAVWEHTAASAKLKKLWQFRM